MARSHIMLLEQQLSPSEMLDKQSIAANRIQSFYRLHKHNSQHFIEPLALECNSDTKVVTLTKNQWRKVESDEICTDVSLPHSASCSDFYLEDEFIDNESDTESYHSNSVDNLHEHEDNYQIPTSSPFNTTPTATMRQFVNVMEPSWLLMSTSERLKGLTTQESLHPYTASWNLSYLIKDLIFSRHLGSTMNLRNCQSATAAEHHERVLLKVKSGEDREKIETALKWNNAFNSQIYSPAVRLLGYALTKVWRMLFCGLHIDIQSLKNLIAIWNSDLQNTHVVFAPTHKTHLDYLILSYICASYNVPMPRIAAGNNLHLPLVGSFLQANGSFFIRRSFKRDIAYKHALKKYVHELLLDGNIVEVFLEGGRSRSGRIQKLRMGFLSIFQEFVLQNPGKTLHIVPVSLDYENVMEVEEYIHQLLGNGKTPETLWGLLKSVWNVLFFRKGIFGNAYIRFGDPLVLNGTCCRQPSQHNGLFSSNSRDVTTVANDLAVALQQCGTITSVSLVATILLWKRQYMTAPMLKRLCNWLLTEVRIRQANVATENVELIVYRGLKMLKFDINKNEAITYANHLANDPSRVLELNYYANQITHLFLPDMAVVAAVEYCMQFKTLRKSESQYESVILSMKDVLRETEKRWDLFMRFFQHKHVNFKQSIGTVIDQFPVGLLQTVYCHDKEMDASLIVTSIRNWNTSRHVHFMLAASYPLFETLWLATNCINNWMQEKRNKRQEVGETIKYIQVEAQEQWKLEYLLYPESLSSENIRQSLEYLIDGKFINAHVDLQTQKRFIVNDRPMILKQLAQDVSMWRQPTTFLYKPNLYFS